MSSLEDMSTNELLEYAKKQAEGNTLFQTLLNDPSTRRETLKLVKAKNPTMVIPELDTNATLEARLEEEGKKREALEQQIRIDQINARIEKERERVKKEYGLTAEDVAEVEKLMVDPTNPIPNYDGAARVHKASKQLATPTSTSIAPPVYEMPEKSVWGAGVGNRAQLDKIALGEAYKALNELRGGKAA